MTEKIFVTPEGMQKLKDEYKELTEVRRPEIAERIEKASSLGDISENAEYTTAKEDQSFVEGRISELEQVINNAEVIEGSGDGTVQVGCKVTVHVEGSEEEFHIVGALEANPEKKKISHESPLGTALIGKKVGDKIQVEAPVGDLSYTVLKVN